MKGSLIMAKNIDWANLGFGYIQTDKRFVSDFKNGSWDDGRITDDATVCINECAGVLQYAQTVFEGLKAYTTADGSVVTFRPDLNAERLIQSTERLKMPTVSKEKFIDAVEQRYLRIAVGEFLVISVDCAQRIAGVHVVFYEVIVFLVALQLTFGLAQLR